MSIRFYLLNYRLLRLVSFLLCFILIISFIPVRTNALAVELTGGVLLSASAVIAACLVALGYKFVNDSAVNNVLNTLRTNPLLSALILTGDYIRCRVDENHRTYAPLQVVQAVSDSTISASGELVSTEVTTSSPVGILTPNTTYSLTYSDFVSAPSNNKYYLWYRSKSSGSSSSTFSYYRPNANSTLTIVTNSSGRIASIIGTNWDKSYSSDFSSYQSSSINYTNYLMPRYSSYITNGNTYYTYQYSIETGIPGYSSYAYTYLTFYAGFNSTVTNTVTRSLDIDSNTAVSGSLTSNSQPASISNWVASSVTYNQSEYVPVLVPPAPVSAVGSTQSTYQSGNSQSNVINVGSYNDKVNGGTPTVDISDSVLLPVSYVLPSVVVALGYEFNDSNSVDYVTNYLIQENTIASFVEESGLIRIPVDTDGNSYVPVEMIQAISDSIHSSANVLVSSNGQTRPLNTSNGSSSSGSISVLAQSDAITSWLPDVAVEDNVAYLPVTVVSDPDTLVDATQSNIQSGNTSSAVIDVGRFNDLINSGESTISFNDNGAFVVSDVLASIVNALGYEFVNTSSVTSVVDRLRFGNGISSYIDSYGNISLPVSDTNITYIPIDMVESVAEYISSNTVSLVSSSDVVRYLTVSSDTAISPNLNDTAQPIAISGWLNNTQISDGVAYLPLKIPSSYIDVLEISQSVSQSGVTSLEVISLAEDRESQFDDLPPIIPAGGFFLSIWHYVVAAFRESIEGINYLMEVFRAVVPAPIAIICWAASVLLIVFGLLLIFLR